MRASSSLLGPSPTLQRSFHSSSNRYEPLLNSSSPTCVQRMLRVCRVFPPRMCLGARSTTRTRAPRSSAAIAATSAGVAAADHDDVPLRLGPGRRPELVALRLRAGGRNARRRPRRSCADRRPGRRCRSSSAARLAWSSLATRHAIVAPLTAFDHVNPPWPGAIRCVAASTPAHAMRVYTTVRRV